MRAGVIEPARRRRDKQLWRRWERAAPMELWQLDVVGGFLHADGSTVSAGLSLYRVGADGKLDFMRKYDVDTSDGVQFWCGCLDMA